MEIKKKVGRPRKNENKKDFNMSSVRMTDEKYEMALSARKKYNHDNYKDLSKTAFFAMCIYDRSKEILGDENN